MISSDELIEKIRHESDILSKARLLKLLKNDLSLKEISQRLSQKPSYLCHILRLNRLPDIIVDGYYAKNISLSHLFILSRIKNEEELVRAYEKVLTQGLTVSKTEEMVREIIHKVKSQGNYLDESILKRIKENLSKNKESYQVHLTQSRIRSRLIIDLKGALSETTPILKNLLEKIEGEISGE